MYDKLNCGKSSCGGCKDEATHSHKGKDIFFFCDLSDCLKKYKFRKNMNGDQVVEKLLELIDGQQQAIDNLKQSIAQPISNRPEIYFMTNGSQFPLPPQNSTYRKGDILIENSTGNASGVDGKLYFWSGSNFVKAS